MSKSASLEGAWINLNAIREDCRIELEEILDTLPGRICLVLDAELGGLLNHVVPEASRIMKEKGVAYFRQLGPRLGAFPPGPDGGAADDPDHVAYLCRAAVPSMQLVAGQINEWLKDGGSDNSNRRHTLIFCPGRTLACEQWLQDAGALSHLSLGELPGLDLVPLDRDVLTLGLPRLARETYAEGDTGGLAAVARAVDKLQALYGPVPNLKAKGSAAQLVLRQALRLRAEIDTLVLLDREVDLATPLLTPLTYEALVDEFLGIANGVVKLDPALLGQEDPEQPAAKGAGGAGGGAAPTLPAPGGKKVPVALNSGDPLFAAIRDLNVEQLGPYLQGRAKDIRQRYEEFRANRKDATINDLHSFVKKIPGLTQTYKVLSQHINLAEVVQRATDAPPFRRRWVAERALLEGERRANSIEQMIWEDEPPLQVLRMLCLQSITGDGVPKYEAIKREFIQTYGYEYMFSLANLERMGMLKKKESWGGGDSGGARWNTLKRTLKLTNDAVDVLNPNDIAYVSSGYAPLSVRLVEAAAGAGGGWGGGGGGPPGGAMAEVLRLLPGPTAELTQDPAGPPEMFDAMVKRQQEAAALEAQQQAATSAGGTDIMGDGAGSGASTEVVGRGQKKVMVVFYVGGVSYMEIAALRYLSNKREFPYHIIIATTQVIKGDTFMESLLVDMENGYAKQRVLERGENDTS